MDFFNNTVIENTSTILGLLYVIFLIKEKIIAWFFAFISSIFLAYIYYTQQVYLQFILSIYYALMAIYGYILWAKKINSKEIQISELSIKTHLIMIFITLIINTAIEALLIFIVKSSYSTLDSLIFSFSLLATYLQVKKICSNWIYWILINATSILLLINLQLYYLIPLVLAYMVIAIIGYFRWKKKLIK